MTAAPTPPPALGVLPPPLLAAISATGRRLQPAHARQLAAALSDRGHYSSRTHLLGLISAPSYTAAVTPLMDAWAAHPDIHGGVLGAAIQAASTAHDDARRNPGIEIVMSGPSTHVLHPRHTEQALRQLISEASDELWLVTYNLTMYEGLHTALRQAANSGVRILIVAEDPLDNPAFKGDPAKALIGLPITRLRWVANRRASHHTSLHAKIALVDRSVALITSANLSWTAANDNLEAGLILRGGAIPAQLADHLTRLRDRGDLRDA